MWLKTSILAPLLLASPIMAATFFVGSYGGEILTVSFDEKTQALTNVSSTSDSSPAPSWQEVGQNGTVLYTVEETAHDDATLGAVTSYKILDGGKLEKITSATGLSGPVSLGISPDGKTIFTANYAASGVSAYSTDATGALTHLQDWTFTLDAPGTIPSRQDAPHPHQALFDPSGRFVVVPDLGADLLRIFGVNGSNFTVKEPIKTSPGRGPRHGMFYPPTGTPKYYYLIAELACTVSVYKVSYTADDIVLDQLQIVSTLSANDSATPTAGEPANSTPSAAEIAIDPKGTTLYASNRNDNAFSGSHSIAVFKINGTGELTKVNMFPSGVETPRHISLDPTGKWLVAEGQDSDDIKIFSVDSTVSNVTAESVASLPVTGGAVCVQWL